MIDFACKTISKEELIRCSLNLNKTEYHVFNLLSKRGTKLTVSKIARSLNLERTTVQKAMKCLLEKKLARRYQRNLPAGGYEFLYELKDAEEIKARLKKILHTWSKSAEKVIDGL